MKNGRCWVVSSAIRRRTTKPRWFTSGLSARRFGKALRGLRQRSRLRGLSRRARASITFRLARAGTGVDHIPVGPDGKPTDANQYRAELEKLEHSLAWAAETGRAQHDAYDKIAKKQKDRGELIEATRSAFLYVFVGREPRGDRMLSKYRMEPNPAYKPTSRSTAIFAKVRGYAWIDDEAGQLARVEVEVTDDIAIGGFLAKVYKGSHFMQERYEMAPGLWLPSYSQYDFDGRRLFVSFSIHERTFYTNYRRIGPPNEALATIRAELGKSATVNADP